MPFKDKLSDHNISEKEWRIFERHLTKWLSDNSRNLTHEEGKHFRTATAICLTTGVSTGFLTNFLLNRFKLIPNRLTRGLFAVFGGLYTSAFTINSLRKNIYLKLLDSTGPAGYASRKILESTKELSLDGNYIDPIYLPSTYRTGAPNGPQNPYTAIPGRPAGNTYRSSPDGAGGYPSSTNAFKAPDKGYPAGSNTYMQDKFASGGYGGATGYQPPADTAGAGNFSGDSGPFSAGSSLGAPGADGQATPPKAYRTWDEIRGLKG